MSTQTAAHHGTLATRTPAVIVGSLPTEFYARATARDSGASRPAPVTDEPIANYIDEEGVHHVRSDWLRDGEEGVLSQIIVMRTGETVTIYRRYAGAMTAEPVTGFFSAQEAAFLQRAFVAMEDARRPIV